MKYLLDTNICIYLIKQKPPQVLQRFRTHEGGDLGVSSMTVAELQYGVQKSMYVAKNQKALTLFFTPMEIADFDTQAAIIYGEIRAYLEKKGTPIGPLDTLIAAHALSLNVTLVTNNTREFARLPELKLANWVE